MESQVIELGVKIVGVLGVLIGGAKAIYEIQENRKQRKIEFRWKQTKEAKSLIDQMLTEEGSKQATYMIDWTGREYLIEQSQEKEIITWGDVKNGLRIINDDFTDKEVYIRDCFDAFLFYTEFMEQSISNNLFEFKDIIFPIKYYIDTIVKNGLRDAIDTYIEKYEFANSKKFFYRFESWNKQ
jgi:hypothetical protein